jgi:hypothetical protein
MSLFYNTRFQNNPSFVASVQKALSRTMSSGYQEFKPSAELQQYVECYWLHRFETEGERESPVQCCMPFGRLELILHLDNNRCDALFNGQWEKLPPAFLVGLYRTPKGHACRFGSSLQAPKSRCRCKRRRRGKGGIPGYDYGLCGLLCA